MFPRRLSSIVREAIVKCAYGIAQFTDVVINSWISLITYIKVTCRVFHTVTVMSSPTEAFAELHRLTSAESFSRLPGLGASHPAGHIHMATGCISHTTRASENRALHFDDLNHRKIMSASSDPFNRVCGAWEQWKPMHACSAPFVYAHEV